MLADADSHLRAIDAAAWPSIAALPQGPFLAARARRAEAEFARACRKAGLTLEAAAGQEPDLSVGHDGLFRRIAAAGWLGLAESYMAGEWGAPDSGRLVKVLRSLISVGYAPRATTLEPTESGLGELPLDLVGLYSGDSFSHGPGIFSTGVPTSVRESIPSFVPPARRRGRREQKTHFVEVTRLSDPAAVEREDLADAQRRAADRLLDLAQVGSGTHLLVYSAAALQSALRAATRGSVVDVISSDAEQISAYRERVFLEGTGGAVRVELIDAPVPDPQQCAGRYDAIVSADKLEFLSAPERRAFATNCERLLGENGRLAFQAAVATEALNASGRAALQVLRAYVWPGLDYPTTLDVHKLFDSHTALRVTAQVHFGSHYLESLRLQRALFDGHTREAAAAGYDPVFRRLWTFQCALREALCELKMMDTVQFAAVRRHRGGRR